MKGNSWLWLAIAGVGAYVLYQKGWLSLIGMCPAGTYLVQDMLPACRQGVAPPPWVQPSFTVPSPPSPPVPAGTPVPASTTPVQPVSVRRAFVGPTVGRIARAVPVASSSPTATDVPAATSTTRRTGMRFL
jgi:hypothetical protein